MNNFIRIIKNIIVPLVLTGAFLSIQNCNSVPKRNMVETITTTACWSSPCWGYNAPKIVRNSQGHLWIINMFGSYPSSKAQIFRKCGDSGWEEGKIFDAIYQPGMIFLDQAEHLNVIFNSQTEPVKHYRSMDQDNLHNFELIASGNGLDDGRGWYVGVGIHENRIYMA
ncbi:hypothetical protein JXJ21_10310, partial [candidate division KSB1 bacterium]|nr:hypothetical protein [candidate division KSB1 bacterium]